MGITHNLSLEMYFISVSGNNTDPPIREVSGTKRNKINVGIFGGIIGAVIATVACGITFYFLRKRFALLELSTFFKALLWQIYFRSFINVAFVRRFVVFCCTNPFPYSDLNSFITSKRSKATFVITLYFATFKTPTQCIYKYMYLFTKKLYFGFFQKVVFRFLSYLEETEI